MMTNSETIEILNEIRTIFDLERKFKHGNSEKVYAVNIAISALQENTKLKAEIEQLKARIVADNFKKDFKEFCDNRDKEKSELKFREVLE